MDLVYQDPPIAKTRDTIDEVCEAVLLRVPGALPHQDLHLRAMVHSCDAPRMVFVTDHAIEEVFQ